MTVQFGGAPATFQPVAQTWERTAVYSTSVTETYGAGCGNPSVALTPNLGTPPTLGNTVYSYVSNAYLGIAFVAWGTSNTALGSVPLPVPLDPFGFEGCTLLQSGDIILDAVCSATSWNTAQHAVSMPNAHSLIGASLYSQAWTLQPGFNTLGIVTSNGIALTLGDI